MGKVERDGKTVFLPNHWKLLTLQNLEVDLKFEFHQAIVDGTAPQLPVSAKHP